ncbi:MAG: hypothetical protein QOJ63_1397, partial [Solirubrobacteraceae bacterium]|nr:hypothetical protein [Solirubrobacteraceae bacterium]
MTGGRTDRAGARRLLACARAPGLTAIAGLIVAAALAGAPAAGAASGRPAPGSPSPGTATLAVAPASGTATLAVAPASGTATLAVAPSSGTATFAVAPSSGTATFAAAPLPGLGTFPAAQAAAPVEPPTWSDEFDGTSLDPTKWITRANGPRHDGNLTPDAVSVGGGLLTIKTYTEAGKHYSGMIATYKRGSDGFEQTYGYFEARMKFTSSPGQWSAFWLHSPTFGNPIGDPESAGVEMDIAEHRARCVEAPAPTPPATCAPDNPINDRVQQAMVWDGYASGTSKSAVKLSDPLTGLGNGQWHRWALRWTPTQLTFLYDDVVTWTMSAPISRRSQYIILSSEVGRFFAGAIPAAGYGSLDTSTTNMQVDYVRVWAIPPTAPSNTAAPAVTGIPEVGQALACSTGTWSGDPPLTFTYAWLSDGSRIAGASASGHAVQDSDSGHALSCRVTATNAAGSASALSNAIRVPDPPAPAPAPAP